MGYPWILQCDFVVQKSLQVKNDGDVILRSKLLIASGALLAIAAFVVIAISSNHRKATVRRDISQLHNSFALGDTRQEVLADLEVFRKSSDRQWMTVHSSSTEAPETVSVETPLEFGARNWILHLLFANGKLVGIGVRTEDSDKSRPPRAPLDKIADRYAEVWHRRYVKK